MQLANVFMQFTDDEWAQIKSTNAECDNRQKRQLSTFFRLWCLKESYIKAQGTGLGIDLRTLSFQINSELSDDRLVVTDTEFYRDGARDTSVQFEECLIDGSHCCAVCCSSDGAQDAKIDFRTVDFDELVKDLSSINSPIDYQKEWGLYKDKHEVKPF